MENKKALSNNDMSKISVPAARLAIAASAAVFLLLVGLHALSPEFDPSWRMVSEYANGTYGWVLSLMFAAWALSSWALAFAIRSQLKMRAGKVGLVFLVAAGVGEAMAAAFNINHPLHGLAGLIGVGSLPVAALLLSTQLARTQAWSKAKKTLLWLAHLTWVSVVLLIVTLVIMGVTYTRAGGEVPADGKSLPLGTVLPSGVVAVVGWADRILLVVYLVWVIAVAWQAIRLRSQKF